MPTKKSKAQLAREAAAKKAAEAKRKADARKAREAKARKAATDAAARAAAEAKAKADAEAAAKAKAEADADAKAAAEAATKEQATQASIVVLDVSDRLVTGEVDGKGALWRHVKSGPWSFPAEVKAGGYLHDIGIQTIGRTNPADSRTVTQGLMMTGDNARVERVSFADGGGFCIKAQSQQLDSAGSPLPLHNLIVRDVAAQTFTDYLFYGTLCADLLLSGVKCVGGSTTESILRFDECSGIVERFDLDYTTATRKACIRGAFTGIIRNGRARGGIVGLNPLGGGDGGQGVGITKFRRDSFRAADTGKQVATLADAIARGVKDHRELVRACALAAGLALTDAEIDADLAYRAYNLAKRSVVTWENVVIEHALRWEPGTKYVYNGGCIDGTLNHGNCFGEIPMQYPEPPYLLPGETPRPAWDVEFNGTEFIGNAELKGVRFNGCKKKAL